MSEIDQPDGCRQEKSAFVLLLSLRVNQSQAEGAARDLHWLVQGMGDVVLAL